MKALNEDSKLSERIEEMKFYLEIVSNLGIAKWEKSDEVEETL